MAELVYLLCASTSLLCTVLLTRAFKLHRTRLLLGGTLCFAGLTVNNVLLFIDLIVVPNVDLEPWRLLVAISAMLVLIVSLVWRDE